MFTTLFKSPYFFYLKPACESKFLYPATKHLNEEAAFAPNFLSGHLLSDMQ